MGFPRQEYWNGLPFPSPGDLSNPGIEPRSPTLEADALTSEPPWKPNSASTRSLLFLSFIVPILGQNISLISPIFLKRSLVFLLLSSNFICCLLKVAFLCLHAVLWKSALSWIFLPLSPLLFTSLLSLAICKAAFPGGSEVKASACNVGDLGSIPGSGRPPREGNGSPLQYSCLGNPMDRGAWQATVHGVAKSRTRLSNFTSLQGHLKPNAKQGLETLGPRYLKPQSPGARRTPRSGFIPEVLS